MYSSLLTPPLTFRASALNFQSIQLILVPYLQIYYLTRTSNAHIKAAKLRIDLRGVRGPQAPGISYRYHKGVCVADQRMTALNLSSPVISTLRHCQFWLEPVQNFPVCPAGGKGGTGWIWWRSLINCVRKSFSKSKRGFPGSQLPEIGGRNF